MAPKLLILINEIGNACGSEKLTLKKPVVVSIMAKCQDSDFYKKLGVQEIEVEVLSL